MDLSGIGKSRTEIQYKIPGRDPENITQDIHKMIMQKNTPARHRKNTFQEKEQ